MRGFSLLLTALFLPPLAADPLYDAIRRNDCPALQRLLASGTPSDTPGELGVTPLMSAAAYAAPACLTALIDKGANVSATTQSGGTPLFYAAHDLAKTRLLVEHGAKVRVKDKAGSTPFIRSLTFHGNAAVTAYLLEHGADPNDTIPQGNALAYAAHFQQDAQLAALASKHGVAGSPLSSFTSFTQPVSPTVAASLLKSGFDPNSMVRTVTLRYPVLAGIAHERAEAAVHVFLEGGANPNARGNTGITPLIMAVTAYAPSLAIVRELLEKGANVNATDDKGHTALDWARLQGDNAIVKALLAVGAKPGTAFPPAPSPVATPREARSAIALAVERLTPIGPNFFSKSTCISCHNTSLPAMAMRAAHVHGVPVAAETLAHGTRATFEQWSPSWDTLLQGRRSVGGFVANISYGLLQLRGENQPATPLTDAIVETLVRTQEPDGSWNIPDCRPPLGNGPIKWTALVMRGIDAYAAPATRKRAAQTIARGMAFLRANTPADTQDAAFLMLALNWNSAPKAEIAAAAQRLLALQRRDGGWAQTDAMAPDAYATGQALWALHEAGRLRPTNAAYQRGTAFLLRNQQEDGTWFVRSRALAFQPYFETGFPHGTNQFISAAATSWAVLALSHTLPAH